MGRPSSYTEEVAGTICERIAAGESTRQICADEAMPALRTVFQWLEKDAAFAQQYARAREEQAETLAGEIIAIADAREGDVMVDDEGRRIIDNEAVARARLRVDARKWVAAKLRPKVYGDAVDVKHSGNVNLNVTPTDMSVL